MVLEDIAQYLQTQGLGTVKTAANSPSAWSIYKGFIVPGDRDDIIVLSEFPHGPSTDSFGATIAAVEFESVGLQVTVRHPDYFTGRNKMDSIWQTLHKTGGLSLPPSNKTYLLIEALTSPGFVGKDEEKGRSLIGCAFAVHKQLG